MLDNRYLQEIAVRKYKEDSRMKKTIKTHIVAAVALLIAFSLAMAVSGCSGKEGTITSTKSVVGTISDAHVVLDIKTHAWAVDYWQDQSDEVKARADRDAFNCAAQTVKDMALIAQEGNPEVKDTVILNDRYNYACYQYETKSTEITNVVTAMFNAPGFLIHSEKMNNGEYIDYFVTRDVSVPEEVLSAVGDVTKVQNRAVALRCFEAVKEQTDPYDVLGKLLTYFGIPAVAVKDDNQTNWLQVCIDGEWSIIDVTQDNDHAIMG